MSRFYKHPKALIETECIGEDTRIWAFAHILPGAKIGRQCNICDHTFIENNVTIGDRVTIKSGVQLWDGMVVEDDVFIGPNVTFTNDKFPRSKCYPEKYAETIIKKGSSIGANATILPAITIGMNAMVGAGAVVTRDVPPNAIAVGNPAYIKSYASSLNSQRSSIIELSSQLTPNSTTSDIKGVEIFNLPVIDDMRGTLTFAEYGQYLPFIPKRYFLVYDVASKEIRGEHAHRTLHQFLVCIKGNCALVVDDGQTSQEIVLDRPNIGVYLPPMVWGIQYKYTQDAVLLVLASDIYDANDYIRDYDEYLKLKGIRQK